jgi:flagella basal body P-ring formation protein FlgA
MKTTLLALAFALLGTTAALAVPVLKGDITVNAAIVTVGDMFDNAGELSETAIFRAPAPGTTGIVPLADVQAAAKLIGITDFDNVGYMRVRVMRASTTVDEAMLDKLINDGLSARGLVAQGITAEPHFDLSNVSFAAEQVDAPAALTDLRYTPGTGIFAARFSIAGIDQPIDLTGTIQLMTEAPRLIATTPAGTILTKTDFEMAEVPVATANAAGYADLDQLVGKQLVRQFRAGMMLKPTDVGDPTVVTRNSLVTVTLKAGAMTLTVKGQALSTAAAGEPVDVLNPVSKKILHGVAKPDGTVEIITASATTVASL